MLSVEDLPPLRPRRQVCGISPVPMPSDEAGRLDWDAYSAQVVRTADAGLTPAVNANSSELPLVDAAARREVLRRTRHALDGREFVAGAWVLDRPGDVFNLQAYVTEIETIFEHGGWPMVAPSYGLAHQDAEHVVNDHEAIAACCDRFLAMEACPSRAPAGRVYSAEVFEALVDIPQCVGICHGSLCRTTEWQRLTLRDRVRPEFLVLSGNDLALDMVTYGSDHLVGVSSFAPDWFALRDRLWREGDARFYELNDLLQHLAWFAFRDPVASWRHSAAQFVHLRGWTKTDRTHDEIPERPAGDVDILRNVLIAIEAYVDEVVSSQWSVATGESDATLCH